MIRIISAIKRRIALLILKIKWRKLNKNNFTHLNSLVDISKVTCGNYSYGQLNIISYGNPNEKLKIGNFVSIADDVTFLLGGEHHPRYISNYPFLINLLRNDLKFKDNTSKGPISVNDDVWIGKNSLIMSGVTLGQGSIIAAGSVIVKDIPPYSIATTNRIIKYRFSKEKIDLMNNIEYSNLDKQSIIENIDLFYTEVDEDVINKLIELTTKNRGIEHDR